MFASMKTYEVILNHVNRVSVLIITNKGEEVNQEINTGLHRGTTMWDANGGYTHEGKTVLFCVIVKGELPKLKKIVKKTDPKSFVTCHFNPKRYWTISSNMVMGYMEKRLANLICSQ